jgi:DNA-binding transcriptional LysR family regulator
MDLRQLRYFTAVAETGHMTRAAERLGMQQPPLSQQIRALEKHLGVALFVRHPKGVRLTAAGTLLHSDAQRILGSVAALEERMGRVARGLLGVLSVGFTSSAAAHAFTPRVLRACRHEYPDIALRISENNAAELIEALESRVLHCAFLRVPVARPEVLSFDTLLHEPLVLALPLGHALAEAYRPRETVPWKALNGQRLILVRRPGAPGLYANLLALLERHGVDFTVQAEVDRMMTNINLVAAGEGISVVPESMQGVHAHSVTYRPLPPDTGLQAPITLAYRKDDVDAVTAILLNLARRLARDGASADGGAAARLGP